MGKQSDKAGDPKGNEEPTNSHPLHEDVLEAIENGIAEDQEHHPNSNEEIDVDQALEGKLAGKDSKKPGVLSPDEDKKDPKSDVANLAASDIPIPTELRRNQTLPGAVEVPGIESGNVPQRAAVSEADHSHSHAEAPLISATLVEPPHAAEAASTREPPLIKAEPMDDDHTVSIQDKLQAAMWPESQRKRRRLFIFIAILVCCGLIAGIAVGVTLALLADDGFEGQGSSDPVDVGNETEEDALEPSNQLLKAYYMVQWGVFAPGCTIPENAVLSLRCDQGGTLKLINVPEEVDCATRGPLEVCVLPKGHRGSDVGNKPEYRDRQLQSDPVGVNFPSMKLTQGHIIASCEGKLVDQSMSLRANAFLAGEVPEQVLDPEDGPANDQTGVCSHMWYERNETGDGVARVYGGAGSVFVSNSLICPEKVGIQSNFRRLSLQPATCADGGGLLAGSLNEEPGEEKVPICTFLGDCSISKEDCPVGGGVGDPCREECEIDYDMVRVGWPSFSDIRDCSIPDTNQEFANTLVERLDPYRYEVTEEMLKEEMPFLERILPWLD